MKIILITGINGSGGSYLAEHLLKRLKKVKIFGTIRKNKVIKSFNLRNLAKNKNIKFLKCDLNNFTQTKKIFKKIKFDYIYHLASNADVLSSFSSPREIVINNNNCTLNLLESLRIINSKTKIIICSTSEVYGNIGKKNLKMNEQCGISPINPYAVSKTFQDLISQNYSQIYGMNIVITRMFTYFNARRSNLFASAFADQIVKIENGKEKILKHGNLESQRTVLDIRDAMEAYYLAGIKGKSGQIYNIGGQRKATVKEILLKLVRLSKNKITTKLNKKLLRPKDINFQIPDASKFKKHTLWKQKFKIDESLNYLINESREKFKFNLDK